MLGGDDGYSWDDVEAARNQGRREAEQARFDAFAIKRQASALLAYQEILNSKEEGPPFTHIHMFPVETLEKLLPKWIEWGYENYEKEFQTLEENKKEAQKYADETRERAYKEKLAELNRKMNDLDRKIEKL